MRIVAIMPARNEAWIIGLSIRAALEWVDHIVVLDHASTDETPAILSAIKRETGRLTILREESPEWAEMHHRQRLLDAARAEMATHIALIDADEVLSGNLLPWIRNQLVQIQPGAALQIPMRNVYSGIEQYRVGDASYQGRVWGQAVTTIGFADAVSLAWAAEGYQHHQREPRNSRIALRIYGSQLEGGVMHLQFASRRRLLAKHALYQMDEVLRWPGRRPVAEIAREYSMAPDWEGANFAQIPAAWWEPYAESMPELDVDREPWQEAEVRWLLDEHGAEKFAGLNLFGLAEVAHV